MQDLVSDEMSWLIEHKDLENERINYHKLVELAVAVVTNGK